MVELNELIQGIRMEFEEGVSEFGSTTMALQEKDILPGSWLLQHFGGKDSVRVNIGNPESAKKLIPHVVRPTSFFSGSRK